MSALARYFNSKGVEIFGYDIYNSSLTRKLEAEGMKIHYQEIPDNIPENIDLVIYTPAIPVDHSELRWFRDHNFKILKRSEVLGLLSRDKKCIAVAGTHGKTSTSSLIAHILTNCGLAVSAFIGGILAGSNSNYLEGDSEWIVLEADEYDRSFLALYPDILVILSMDADHLDIYGNHQNMIKAYEQLSLQVKNGGYLIMMDDFSALFHASWKKDLEDKNVQLVIAKHDFSIDNLRIENSVFRFDYRDKQRSFENLPIRMPGKHNVSNASVAINIAGHFKLPESCVRDALDNFKGIKRRFEFLKSSDPVIIDDYAHHPEELKSAIETINALYPGKRVVGIFQPHLYSRTRDFYREFAQELSKLPEIWLLEIYPAREKPMEGIESGMVYNLIRNDNKKLLKSKDLLEALKIRKDEIDVLVTLGASDIDKYHEQIIEIFK